MILGLCGTQKKRVGLKPTLFLINYLLSLNGFISYNYNFKNINKQNIKIEEARVVVQVKMKALFK